jgi:hypothetical protein
MIQSKTNTTSHISCIDTSDEFEDILPRKRAQKVKGGEEKKNALDETMAL